MSDISKILDKLFFYFNDPQMKQITERAIDSLEMKIIRNINDESTNISTSIKESIFFNLFKFTFSFIQKEDLYSSKWGNYEYCIETLHRIINLMKEIVNDNTINENFIHNIRNSYNIFGLFTDISNNYIDLKLKCEDIIKAILNKIKLSSNEIVHEIDNNNNAKIDNLNKTLQNPIETIIDNENNVVPQIIFNKTNVMIESRLESLLVNSLDYNFVFFSKEDQDFLYNLNITIKFGNPSQVLLSLRIFIKKILNDYPIEFLLQNNDILITIMNQLERSDIFEFGDIINSLLNNLLIKIKKKFVLEKEENKKLLFSVQIEKEGKGINNDDLYIKSLYPSICSEIGINKSNKAFFNIKDLFLYVISSIINSFLRNYTKIPFYSGVLHTYIHEYCNLLNGETNLNNQSCLLNPIVFQSYINFILDSLVDVIEELKRKEISTEYIQYLYFYILNITNSNITNTIYNENKQQIETFFFMSNIDLNLNHENENINKQFESNYIPLTKELIKFKETFISNELRDKINIYSYIQSSFACVQNEREYFQILINNKNNEYDFKVNDFIKIISKFEFILCYLKYSHNEFKISLSKDFPFMSLLSKLVKLDYSEGIYLFVKNNLNLLIKTISLNEEFGKNIISSLFDLDNINLMEIFDEKSLFDLYISLSPSSNCNNKNITNIRNDIYKLLIFLFEKIKFYYEDKFYTLLPTFEKIFSLIEPTTENNQLQSENILLISKFEIFSLFNKIHKIDENEKTELNYFHSYFLKYSRYLFSKNKNERLNFINYFNTYPNFDFPFQIKTLSKDKTMSLIEKDHISLLNHTEKEFIRLIKDLSIKKVDGSSLNLLKIISILNNHNIDLKIKSSAIDQILIIYKNHVYNINCNQSKEMFELDDNMINKLKFDVLPEIIMSINNLIFNLKENLLLSNDKTNSNMKYDNISIDNKLSSSISEYISSGIRFINYMIIFNNLTFTNTEGLFTLYKNILFIICNKSKSSYISLSQDILLCIYIISFNLNNSIKISNKFCFFNNFIDNYFLIDIFKIVDYSDENEVKNNFLTSSNQHIYNQYLKEEFNYNNDSNTNQYILYILNDDFKENIIFSEFYQKINKENEEYSQYNHLIDLSFMNFFGGDNLKLNNQQYYIQPQFGSFGCGFNDIIDRPLLEIYINIFNFFKFIRYNHFINLDDDWIENSNYIFSVIKEIIPSSLYKINFLTDSLSLIKNYLLDYIDYFITNNNKKQLEYLDSFLYNYFYIISQNIIHINKSNSFKENISEGKYEFENFLIEVINGLELSFSFELKYNIKCSQLQNTLYECSINIIKSYINIIGISGKLSFLRIDLLSFVLLTTKQKQQNLNYIFNMIAGNRIKPIDSTNNKKFNNYKLDFIENIINNLFLILQDDGSDSNFTISSSNSIFYISFVKKNCLSLLINIISNEKDVLFKKEIIRILHNKYYFIIKLITSYNSDISNLSLKLISLLINEDFIFKNNFLLSTFYETFISSRSEVSLYTNILLLKNIYKVLYFIINLPENSSTSQEIMKINSNMFEENGIKAFLNKVKELIRRGIFNNVFYLYTTRILKICYCLYDYTNNINNNLQYNIGSYISNNSLIITNISEYTEYLLKQINNESILMNESLLKYKSLKKSTSNNTNNIIIERLLVINEILSFYQPFYLKHNENSSLSASNNINITSNSTLLIKIYFMIMNISENIYIYLSYLIENDDDLNKYLFSAFQIFSNKLFNIYHIINNKLDLQSFITTSCQSSNSNTKLHLNSLNQSNILINLFTLLKNRDFSKNTILNIIQFAKIIPYLVFTDEHQSLQFIILLKFINTMKYLYDISTEIVSTSKNMTAKKYKFMKENIENYNKTNSNEERLSELYIYSIEDKSSIVCGISSLLIQSQNIKDHFFNLEYINIFIDYIYYIDSEIQKLNISTINSHMSQSKLKIENDEEFNHKSNNIQFYYNQYDLFMSVIQNFLYKNTSNYLYYNNYDNEIKDNTLKANSRLAQSSQSNQLNNSNNNSQTNMNMNYIKPTKLYIFLNDIHSNSFKTKNISDKYIKVLLNLISNNPTHKGAFIISTGLINNSKNSLLSQLLHHSIYTMNLNISINPLLLKLYKSLFQSSKVIGYIIKNKYYEEITTRIDNIYKQRIVNNLSSTHSISNNITFSNNKQIKYLNMINQLEYLLQLLVGLSFDIEFNKKICGKELLIMINEINIRFKNDSILNLTLFFYRNMFFNQSSKLVFEKNPILLGSIFAYVSCFKDLKIENKYMLSCLLWVMIFNNISLVNILKKEKINIDIHQALINIQTEIDLEKFEEKFDEKNNKTEIKSILKIKEVLEKILIIFDSN